MKVPNIRSLIRRGEVASVVGIGEPSVDFLSSERGGLKVAAVFVRAPNHAAYSFPATDDHDFEAVAQKATPAGVIDKVEAMFPRFQKALWDDSSSAQAAQYILSADSPDLLVIHFADIQAEQIMTGALSVYTRETLENDDELIGEILAKVPKDAVVAIVSNHGAENANYVLRPAVLLREPVEVSNGLVGTSDPAVADRLRKLMNEHKRNGIVREVPMAEVRTKAPALGHWVAAFDTTQNCVASAEDHGPALGPGTHLAVWDFWPTHPNFRSVFVMTGPGVPNRKLGDIDVNSVAERLADAAGVRLRKD